MGKKYIEHMNYISHFVTKKYILRKKISVVELKYMLPMSNLRISNAAIKMCGTTL